MRTQTNCVTPSIGQVWKEHESPVWNDIAESETQEVTSFHNFEVDWSTFNEPNSEVENTEPEAQADTGEQTDQVDDFESTDIPDSIFGSMPSTPTDVTSLWGDFPVDANEAFADALDDLHNDNTFDDRILEETEVIVRQTVEIDGVQHYYLHKANWDDMIFIFDNPESKKEPVERYASVDTLKNDSANSPNSIQVSHEFLTPRITPQPPPDVISENDMWSEKSVSDRSSGSSIDEQEDEDEPSWDHRPKSKPRFRRLLKSMDSEMTVTAATSTSTPVTTPSPVSSLDRSKAAELFYDASRVSSLSDTSDTSEEIPLPPPPPPFGHRRQHSNISNLSSEDIDMLSDVERKELIREQLAECNYLPPLPSEPIYDYPCESDLTDGSSTPDNKPQLPHHGTRRPRPPPIPPRLSERRNKVLQ